MSSLAAKARQIAIQRLEEDPYEVHMVERFLEVIRKLLEAEALDVDAEVAIAATWAAAALGVSCWLGAEDAYEVDDVCRDLGDQVARIVSWTVEPECLSEEEYLFELMETGPVEARLIVLARALVKLCAGNHIMKLQANRVMRLLPSIPGLAVKVMGAGWPVNSVEGEA